MRMALESSGLDIKEAVKAEGLVLRSDSGSKPPSRVFIEFLRLHGVTGQYTGYDAPDHKACVERTIPTVKKEEVRPNKQSGDVPLSP